MPRSIYDDILRDARVKLTEMFNQNFREHYNKLHNSLTVKGSKKHFVVAPRR